VTRRDEFVAAVRAGRAAEVGARNPFVGQGILADLWRGGYNAMLAQRIGAQSETPRP
jgi:hypothetical protein